MFRSSDGDTDIFDVVNKDMQGDTQELYLFIFCVEYALRTSIDKIKENDFTL